LIIEATEIFEWNYNCNSEITVNVGGARSSKSYSLAQLFVIKMLTENNKKFLLLRKTLPSMRISTYKLMIDILSELNIYEPENHNKTNRTYSHKNNFIHFTGLDDPQKIKSTEWNYVWMEEANEFTWEDFVTLKTRMSAKSKDGKPNRMFLSLNPCDEQSWVNQRLIKGGPPLYPLLAKEGTGEVCKKSKVRGVSVFKSNYLNNPFLSKDYINSLLSLKEEDETYYKIYTLGEWALPKNLIYGNWEVTDKFPDSFDETIYGLDFGFNNPTALIKINYHDGNIYPAQLIYRTKLTNEQLIAQMEELIENKRDYVYADCAEPQRIEEISRAGFNVYPAEKSVGDGIDFVKRRKLFINSDSIDVISEIKKYKWKEDRNGNILDEPVKFMDHSMDAVRYGIYSHHIKHSGKDLKLAFI
jgi:phage terminase large subunit